MIDLLSKSFENRSRLMANKRPEVARDTRPTTPFTIRLAFCKLTLLYTTVHVNDQCCNSSPLQSVSSKQLTRILRLAVVQSHCHTHTRWCLNSCCTLSTPATNRKLYLHLTSIVVFFFIFLRQIVCTEKKSEACQQRPQFVWRFVYPKINNQSRQGVFFPPAWLH